MTKNRNLPPQLPCLPLDWEWVTLQELVQPNRGICYGVVQPGNHTPSGVPIIRAKAIKNGQIDEQYPLTVAPEIDAKHCKSRLVGGEIVITLVGEYFGEVAVVPPELAGFNTARAVGVVPIQNDAQYVSLAMRAPITQHYIKTWATTTAQPTLNLCDVARLPIPMPPQWEREAIAHILGTLDDKIELNREMNKTLEAMARAIFKSWFVDFDPVRAKMEGRQPAGMDAATAELFPDEFEESALGMIPKAWRVATVGEVLELAYGKALKENARRFGSIPVYGSNGQIGWHDEALVDTPGIIVGRKGNAGTVVWCPTAFFPIDTTFYVVPKGSINSLYYLLYTLRSQDLPSLGADSAVPGLNRNMAYINQILVPESKCLSVFDFHVETIYKTIQLNNEQSRTLASIRDTLLPKLLSGEIRVKEAEKVVETVL